jgi:hypothetical protein
MKRPLLVAAVAFVSLAIVSTASASVVRGQVPRSGFQVVVVDASGLGAKARMQSNGSFSVGVRRLSGASIHLVRTNGDYFGPVLLGGGGSQVYATVRGSRVLNLGTLTMRRGYAFSIMRGRYQTTAPYTVVAQGGVPIGAGRNGYVMVGGGQGPLGGLNGAGRDTDLDGIPGVFDVDDNGNLILDNVDTTGRSGVGSSATANTVHITSVLFSSGPTVANANLGIGSSNLTRARNAIIPTGLEIATAIADGRPSARLDCLGSVYCNEHSIGEEPFPQVNGAPVLASGGIVPIEGRLGAPAYVGLGSRPGQAGSGDTFLQVAGGRTFPGIANFAFATTPALKSYQLGAGATSAVTYSGAGTASIGMNASAVRISVPGATPRLTLTFWRPQRTALPGESSTGGFVDIGGLTYSIATPSRPVPGSKADCTGAYQNPFSSTPSEVPIVSPTGMSDPVFDAPANAANTLTFTVDLSTCFSWSAIPNNTRFSIVLQGESLYGDIASRTIYLRKTA